MGRGRQSRSRAVATGYVSKAMEKIQGRGFAVVMRIQKSNVRRRDTGYF